MIGDEENPKKIIDIIFKNKNEMSKNSVNVDIINIINKFYISYNNSKNSLSRLICINDSKTLLKRNEEL